MKNNKLPILLVDNECAFCNRSVAFIINHGGREKFRFVSLFSDEGKEILRQYGLPEGYDKSIVLLEDSKIHLKSDAALRIAEKLKGKYKYLSFFRIVPRTVRNFFYDTIAKHRHLL